MQSSIGSTNLFMSSETQSPVSESSPKLETFFYGEFIDRIEGQDLFRPHRCDSEGNTELSASPHCDIWIFFQPDIWWRTIGPVHNGLYSLKNDKALRNCLHWPRIKYQLYDVEQDNWIDMPTFSHIEIRPHDFLLIRRASGPQTEYGNMGKLIKELRALYYLAEPPLPPHSSGSCRIAKELSPCAARAARVQKRACSPDDVDAAPSSKQAKLKLDSAGTVNPNRKNALAGPSRFKLDRGSSPEWQSD